MLRLAAGLLCLFCAWCATVRANDIHVAGVFGDGMVLQRDLPVPVWGWATPGEAVTVTFGGQTVQATAAADGRWQATLAPLAASATGRPLTVQPASMPQPAVFKDVLVGEVWLCSGQSNMQFTLPRASNGEQEVAAADFPTLRYCQVKGGVAFTPKVDVGSTWSVCTPATAKDYSAVAYLFGRELLQTQKVPVGLIHFSQGWTPGEAWMSHEALVADPALKYIADRWDEYTQAYPTAKPAYDAQMEAWKAAKAAAEKAGTAVPPQPKGPKDPNFIHRASGFYNGGIAPLAPVALRGVIWYQGETNDSRAYQYRLQFPALIKDWRRLWGREFPFLFVQVAAVLPADPTPVNSEWAELRESQALALALPQTGMACAIDLADPVPNPEVHPKNKQDVAHRLALLARAQVYGEKELSCTGPSFAKFAVEGGKVRVSFKDLGGGLVCKGDAPLTFALAGEDRHWVWASAKLDGDTVLVWSDAVPAPVAVRYAWANNPAGCNLYGKSGLPVIPFRSDDWPEKTRDAIAMPVEGM